MSDERASVPSCRRFRFAFNLLKEFLLEGTVDKSRLGGIRVPGSAFVGISEVSTELPSQR